MVVAPESFDEGLTVAGEIPHVGFHVGSHAIDCDKERELSLAQRIEDLTIVAAGPHSVAVGDHAKPSNVFTSGVQLAYRPADSGERETRVEERTHHPQCNEIPE